MDQPKERRAYMGSVKEEGRHHTKGGERRTRCGPTPHAKPVHPIIDMFLVRYRVESVGDN